MPCKSRQSRGTSGVDLVEWLGIAIGVPCCGLFHARCRPVRSVGIRGRTVADNGPGGRWCSGVNDRCAALRAELPTAYQSRTTLETELRHRPLPRHVAFQVVMGVP